MTKKKKNICIVGYNIGDNTFGVSRTYMYYFHKYGNVYVITPSQYHLTYDCDLLVLPGGRDVSTLRYNELPEFYTTPPDPILEWFDMKSLPSYIESNIPIFGIDPTCPII